MAAVLSWHRQLGDLVAAGVGVHVVGHQRRVVGHGPARGVNASTGTRAPAAGASGPVAAGHPEEAALLDHQRHRAAFGLEQVGGGVWRPP